MINRMNIRKNSSRVYFVIFLLCILVLTSSFSFAKYINKNEYPFLLCFIQEPEHFIFKPDTSSEFEIPYSGYYAFQLWGGSGGSGMRHTIIGAFQDFYNLGGSGGEVKATRYFEKGDVLTITVGKGGGTSNGGYNGGGDGGSATGIKAYHYFGGGGGGATDVRISPYDLSDRILVAGGGGGASGGNYGSIDSIFDTTYDPAPGGNGGTMENLDGTSGTGSGSGDGGTQISGGEGAQFGDSGIGGNANFSGGGGGGGYYGGGGGFGSGGGGGGGSSYIGSHFESRIPPSIPGRDGLFEPNDGLAIISYLGDADNIAW